MNRGLFPKVLVSMTDLTSTFAKWAIYQSPYTVPDELPDVIDSIAAYFRLHQGYGMICDWEYIDMYESDLKLWLTTFIEHSDVCKKWNSPKNDALSGCHQFVSRYSIKSPADDDFIDTWALSRNVFIDLVKLNDELGKGV
jgi:hypothetical protein